MKTNFILAEYLESCLRNFNETIQKREKWYGRSKQSNEHVYIHSPGMISIDTNNLTLDEKNKKELQNSELYKAVIALKNRNE